MSATSPAATTPGAASNGVGAPIAALHVLNAFAMLALAGVFARQNWAFRQ